MSAELQRRIPLIEDGHDRGILIVPGVAIGSRTRSMSQEQEHGYQLCRMLLTVTGLALILMLCYAAGYGDAREHVNTCIVQPRLDTKALGLSCTSLSGDALGSYAVRSTVDRW
ncbi:hypothetical protein ACN47E_005644 [Coniothyrium glycines]